MNFSYSVVIRTLGNAGDKYEALLLSISRQTILPEEVIVVVPEDCRLEQHAINERIIRTPKGMVTQRAAGINAAKSDFILVCDDDLQFPPEMVENLYLFLLKHHLDCCLPMEGCNATDEEATISLKRPLLTTLRYAFTGQMFLSRRKTEWLDVLTYTAGHKVFINSNKLDKCYLCRTACFQCFFIKTAFAKAAHFEQEEWLQQGSMSSYAAYDEPVFFSKLNQQGLRMAYSLRTRYQHLDAAAGRQAKNATEAKKIRYFTTARNRTIYWYKFIFLPARALKKLLAIAGGAYGLTNYAIFTILVNLRPRHIHTLTALFRGYREAFQYISDHKKHKPKRNRDNALHLLSNSQGNRK